MDNYWYSQTEGVIKLRLETIKQKDSYIHFGKITASDLIDVYTVEPAVYRHITRDSLDYIFTEQKDNEGDLLFKDSMDYSQVLKRFGGAQRYESQERIDEIASFLDNEQHAFFPNTIILSCELINKSILDEVPEEKQIIEYVKKYNLCYADDIQNNCVNLYIPKTKGSLLLIDGQHRMRGLEESKTLDKNQYEVLVAIYLEYPWSVIAKQFYIVNRTQKSVNKSILYDIAGKFQTDLDEISYLHQLVKGLNELDISPFNSRIKMHGIINKITMTEQEQKLATISQAFLIDYLLRTMTYRTLTLSIFQPIFAYYYQEGKNYKKDIFKFILNYFQVVSNLKKDDWDNPKFGVICKTVGIGALIKVMQVLFTKLFFEYAKMQPDIAIRINESDLIKKLEGLEKVDFRSTEYLGQASGGGLSKLVKDIISKLDYFKSDGNSYDEIVINVKNEYITKYKEWLSVHTSKFDKYSPWAK